MAFDLGSAVGYGSALGGLLLGGSDDYGKYYDTAMDKYMQYADKAESQLGSHETQGRSDLQNYLTQSTQYSQPYINAGNTSLSTYLGALGLGTNADRQSALSSFSNAPGYQYQLNQGLQGVQRGLSSSGMSGSGAEQKALYNYASGLANQNYDSWLSKLSNLAGMGQTSSENTANRTYQTGSSLANLGSTYGQQYSNLYQSIAQAQAEAEMAKAQAAQQSSSGFGSALGGIAGGIASSFL